MHSILISGLTALLMCLLLTPVVRDLFLRFGLVDHPDVSRKVHSRATPRVGGIAVAISYVVAVFCTPAVSHFVRGAALDEHLLLVWRVLPAAGVVFITGLLDDLVVLKPIYKLCGQITAAALAWAAGVRILNVAGQSVDGWIGVALTIIWLVGCTNAFNLIDGLDGLAAGLGFFATITTLVAALLHNNLVLAVAAAPLAGCLVGFLRYNFNPASIFLGDSGSLFIGFLLGGFGIIWSQKCGTLLALTAPLMALSIPLLDTILAISRRFIRRQPIFGADSDHIHHRLLKRGVKPRAAAALLYSFAGIAAGFALLQSVAHDRYKGLIIIIFSVSVWFSIHRLAYIEFGAVGRLFLGGGLRRALQGEVCLRALEESLVKAYTADECWKAIRDSGKVLGFSRVSLEIAGKRYEERFGRAPRENCWSMRVPLSDSDYVEFALEFHSPSQTLPLASFVDIVRASLQSQLQNLRSNLLTLTPSTSAIVPNAVSHGIAFIRSSPAGEGLQIPLQAKN